jgi:uncharacterized protein YodC (DUF2158 family)
LGAFEAAYRPVENIVRSRFWRTGQRKRTTMNDDAARAAATAAAEARAETVGEWVARAIERQAAAEREPSEGGLELRVGLCARLISGGPVMVLTGPETIRPIGIELGRWEATWFHKGNQVTGSFWPATLETAPGA